MQTRKPFEDIQKEYFLNCQCGNESPSEFTHFRAVENWNKENPIQPDRETLERQLAACRVAASQECEYRNWKQAKLFFEEGARIAGVLALGEKQGG